MWSGTAGPFSPCATTCLGVHVLRRCRPDRRARHRADQPISPSHWSADASRNGATITGYRWTPGTSEPDNRPRWSPWSLAKPPRLPRRRSRPGRIRSSAGADNAELITPGDLRTQRCFSPDVEPRSPVGGRHGTFKRTISPSPTRTPAGPRRSADHRIITDLQFDRTSTCTTSRRTKASPPTLREAPRLQSGRVGAPEWAGRYPGLRTTAPVRGPRGTRNW